MEKLFKKNRIVFHPLFETKPYVFIGKHHPLAKKRIICQEDFSNFPYITYEQGEQNSKVFSEELADIFNHNKSIKIDDRATLMNLLIATDCYTIGTGIINSELNSGKIISVPLDNSNLYVIGWIVREDVELSDETKAFIDVITELTCKYSGKGI